MDYNFDKNGWTVIIDNFDVREATQDDINLIAKLISRHTLVVLKNQKQLSLEKELEIIKNTSVVDKLPPITLVLFMLIKNVDY